MTPTTLRVTQLAAVGVNLLAAGIWYVSGVPTLGTLHLMVILIGALLTEVEDAANA